MIIIVVFVMMMIVMAGLLYLYNRQMQVESEVEAPEAPIIEEKPPSIADLHGDCLSNPLNCEVDEVKTTIEDADVPLYEDIYGFKTNLFNMRKELQENWKSGTSEDWKEDWEVVLEKGKEIDQKALKISYDALSDSMQHCKLRIPGERLKRKIYDSRGKEIGTEPTYLVSYRNGVINYAEKDLDEMIDELSKLDKDQLDESIKEHTNKYKSFLNVYGPKLGVKNAGGITKCDYYVKGCAVRESDICHEDAIKKHKDIRDNRPEIINLPEEDYNRELEEAGLVMTEDGVQLSVKNQEIMTGLTDEEKQKIKDRFGEAQEAAESWAQRSWDE